MTDVAPAASENTDAVTNDELVDELRSWLEENWDPDLTVADWWQRLGLALIGMLHGGRKDHGRFGKIR